MLTETEVTVDDSVTMHEAKPLQDLAQHAARSLLWKPAARAALHGFKQVTASQTLQLKEHVALVLVHRMHEHHIAMGRPPAQVAHRANFKHGVFGNAPPVETAARAHGIQEGSDRHDAPRVAGGAADSMGGKAAAQSAA